MCFWCFDISHRSYPPKDIRLAHKLVDQLWLGLLLSDQNIKKCEKLYTEGHEGILIYLIPIIALNTLDIHLSCLLDNGILVQSHIKNSFFFCCVPEHTFTEFLKQSLFTL